MNVLRTNQQRPGMFQIFEVGKPLMARPNLLDENILLASIPELSPYEDISDATIPWATTHRPSLAEGISLMSMYMKGSGRIRYTKKEEVRWKLRTKGDYRLKCGPNLNGSETYLDLSDPQAVVPITFKNAHQLRDGDAIQPMADTGYMFIVQNASHNRDPYGDSTKYFLRPAAGNISTRVPRTLFDPEMRWQKTGAYYGEATSGYGSSLGFIDSYIQFGLPLSTYRKGRQFTDKGISLAMAAIRVNANDRHDQKVADKYIDIDEMSFKAEIETERELTRLTGKSLGKDIIDESSNKYRRGGPGVLEMAEYSHPRRYHIHNDNIVEKIEWDLAELDFDQTPYAQRSRRILTGTYGIMKAIKDMRALENRKPLVYEANEYQEGVKGNAGPLMQMFYKGNVKVPIGWQFDMGGEIIFEHHPIFDSLYISGDVKIPGTSFPASSGIYYLANYGPANGSTANIRLLEKEMATKWTYVCGTWNPLNREVGGDSKFKASHGGAYYELIYESVFGVEVQNVNELMIWKPSQLYK